MCFDKIVIYHLCCTRWPLTVRRIEIQMPWMHPGNLIPLAGFQIAQNIVNYAFRLNMFAVISHSQGDIFLSCGYFLCHSICNMHGQTRSSHRIINDIFIWVYITYVHIYFIISYDLFYLSNIFKKISITIDIDANNKLSTIPLERQLIAAYIYAAKRESEIHHWDALSFFVFSAFSIHTFIINLTY